jgi:hypothetical protein
VVALHATRHHLKETMPRITLNSAAFHGFKFSTGPKRGDGGAIVIAEFSAPWTESNRKAGDWKELPSTVSGAVHLVPGELAATNIVFTPGKGMQMHAFSLECNGASDFICFVPTKEDEERELRFKVSMPGKDPGKKLEAYGRTCGNATGKLVISYDEDAQEQLIDEQQAMDTAKDD